MLAPRILLATTRYNSVPLCLRESFHKQNERRISLRHAGTEELTEELAMNENEIGTIVIEEAIALHKALGPGLLESVYEVILMHRLKTRGLEVTRQVPVPIEYDGIKFEEGFKADLIINNKVMIELKSVETVHNAHKKQLLTYLKLTGIKLGYLLNFGDELMKNGITRTINGQL